MTKVLNNLDNERECRCPACPTYLSDDCPAANQEKLFCARGKTACKALSKKGCICNTCPVWEKYELSDGYFCLSGAAE